ncbi:PAS domain S-box protein [Niveibacterium sp. 24ML]|uniref:PAS domain S-box protein n=1 Tax=Niveibacterium sp. 24ML TaxID=2985512 RepID=UPI002270182C|nr:PAS domain S-box protein [Niveibacterium sp. 24ML]MCX9157054.1 PAS domain S-box protein [Niveibacterium sp. 24ML]
MKLSVTLRGLLSWQFALAGLVPLLLLILGLLGYLLPSFERILRDRDRVLATAVTEQVLSFFAAPQLALDTAATMVRNDAKLNQISAMLDALAATEGGSDALLLIDYEGLVASVGLPAGKQAFRDNYIGLSQLERPFVKQALARDKPVWSETFLSPVSGKISVALALPVDGQVLVAEIDLGRLSGSVSALRDEGGVLAVLVDRAGRIIAHPDQHKAAEQINLSNLEMVRSGLKGRLATGAFALDGIDYFGSAVPIPELGWVALIGQPTYAVFGPLYTAAAITVVGLVMAAIVLLMMGGRSARRMAHRMALVASRARAIADGGEVGGLPSTRVREFAEIGETLDAIFKRLRAREADVRASAERVRTLLEGAPMGVVEVRVEADGQRVVIAANPLVAKVLGAPHDGVLGRALELAFPGFESEALARATAQVAEAGGSREFPAFEYEVWDRTCVLDLFIFRHYQGVVALCFHDMTQRVEAERALRESEQRFSAAFLAVPDYVTLSRASDGLIYDANEAFERITGIPREQAIGRTSRALGILEQPEQREELARRVLQDGRAERLPISIRRSDGILIEGVVSARLTEINGEACMVAVVRDETEVRRAQRTLQRLAAAGSSGGLRSLLDAAAEGVGAGAAMLVSVQDGDAVRLIGYPAGAEHETALTLEAPALFAAIGQRRFMQLTPTPHEADALAAVLKLRPQSVILAPVSHEGEAGGDTLMVAFAHALEYAETAHSLVQVVAERIGQEFARLRAEGDLRRSQQLFSQLFHASPVALSVSRTSDYRMLDCNEVWCRQFGYELDEVLGRNGAEIGLWANLADRESLLGELARFGESNGREALLCRKGGETLLCSISGRVVSDGEQELLILSLVDVTEIRRNERAVIELNATLEQRVEERTAQLRDANREVSEALERLERAKDNLVQSEKMAALGSIVAGVSHELNTPIGNCLTVTTTLSDATRTLLRDLAQGLRRSSLNEYLSTAEQASDILLRNLTRAAELVASFKQVAVDRAATRRREFRVSEVIDETLLMLRPSLRMTPYTVETSIEVDVVLDSYPGPLGQVLTNLVNNSILHGFEDRAAGEVRIRVAPEGADAVLIEVRDDGQGISEAALRRVFDPFYTTKMGRGGSGLGMHIVHTIVTGLLGGTVDLQSAVGLGTTVTLVVPRRAPHRDDPD